MPRGKKKQASVGFCRECGKAVQAFYFNNKKDNKEKGVMSKKYCSVCKKKVELKISDEKK